MWMVFGALPLAIIDFTQCHQTVTEPVQRYVTCDLPNMQVQHGLVRLGGSARWADQQVDVLLNDFNNGRYALLVGEVGMLRDRRGLSVGIKEAQGPEAC